MTTLIFGAVTGLLWLSTVPPTSSLVAIMFGTRWLAMLFGFAFFSHQVGGFLGVLLGGYVFDNYGSYNPVWWLSVFFGVMSAIINLPIVEQPVGRLEPVGGMSALAPGRRARENADLAWDKQRGARGDIQGDRDREGGRRHQGRAHRFRRSQSDGRRRHRPRRIFHASITKTGSPSPASRRWCAASR